MHSTALNLLISWHDLPPSLLQNNDATFDKFMALSEGDKFVDPAKRALMDQKAKKAGNTVDAPFKTISPMKKSSGLGGFYGTLEGKVAYVPVRGLGRRS